MDPLSIVSVAAAVAQFLDFASRVISNTKEAYKSSLGQNDVDLSKISRDFTSLADTLSSKMSKLIRDGGSENAALEVEKDTLTILDGLCREAEAINKEIQEILGQLQVKGTTKIQLATDSLVVALKRIWSADKIQRLENRLDNNRKQVTMAMLVLSWGQAESLRVTMKQFVKNRRELIEHLNNIDSTTRSYGQQILQLIRPETESKQQEAREILAYAIDSRWAPSSSMAVAADFPGHVSIRIREEQIAEKIMNSLLFETISHREDTVPKAYSDTFEWVFGDPKCAPDGTRLWSDLREWASEQSNSIYWITGKAGAGKSTLTKFLARDKRLEEHLQQWANPSDLLLATYYSWNAGSRLQKSHQGLLRSILHQYLKRSPRLLVPQLFPSRWALIQLFSPDTRVVLPDWQPWELLSAFRALLSVADQGVVDLGFSFKIALIIDGLDEFDDEEDHTALVELLQEAATYHNVKICVSSRPWNVFQDAFQQNPMLQLEKLTHEDIERYVHGQFQKSPGFGEQKHLYPIQAEKLLGDIVHKAQGVFLWVSVVVRSLLVSLQEGDKLSDAQATLDSLPEDLNRLFLTIWDRTGPASNVEGAHYFLLLDVCQRHGLVPYSTTIFWGDEDIPIDIEPAMSEDSFMSCAVSSLSRRLNSRTRGLLEICDVANTWNSRMDYMHRTVKEWVTDNWDMILSTAEPHFDPHLWVVKGEVLRMAMLGDANIQLEPNMVCHHIQELLSVAAGADKQLANTNMLVQVLDKLDSALMRPLEKDSTQSHKQLSKSESKDRLPPGLSKNSVAHWSNHLHVYKAWAPIRRLRARGWETHDFVRLMAQLPIPQYVEYKLHENAGVSKTGPATIPLLVSAIMGGCQENPETWHPRPRTTLERLDFVKFILSHVSLEEVQNTLAFMREDAFFSRSWDAEFITTAKDTLEAYLRAEGLPIVKASSSQDSSRETLVSEDNPQAPGPPTTTSPTSIQASTHAKRSLSGWVRVMFRRKPSI
ncbi:hypothetical protein O1611_g6336 [Lasiodiplodia mahajangana]|uniref:Uncharacterized protein n=1 Tax=Lasiodiplodia mahajangana TaxID=1108764 RepID=A0ACC2JIX1_9PEZI|nr:hypothetical protein O1611_g6336 [Lasiodiplodia mahajangana]